MPSPSAVTLGTQAAPGAADARVRAYLAALERKDERALAAQTHPDAALTHMLSFSGDPEPGARFDGGEAVLGYLRGVMAAMGTIRFADTRVSAANSDTTAFVQATGDFTAADGRPYRNVYIMRVDYTDGLVSRVEEYANPVTYTATFGAPDA